MYIVFSQCGAESHPAFSSAVKQQDGRYRLNIPTMIKGKKARKAYCDDKMRHLRSFLNSRAELIQE